jgi:DNA modification methylase
MTGRGQFRKDFLCYGDNLTFLKNVNLFPDECVDLIYLDPPFNSKRPYNVLFKDVDGTPSAAQIKAFDDTWQWDRDAADKLLEIQAVAPAPLVELLRALQGFLGHSEMYAYLVQMAVRLVQLHRVLKPTGSLYLHCDPTASHYLKMVLDAIFGAKHYLNEITWKRSFAHSDTKQGMRRCGRIRDILLLYVKTIRYTWNPVYIPYDESYVNGFYCHEEPKTGRRYQLTDLTAAKPGGDTSYEWRGKKPYKGRFWAYSKKNMEQFERAGRLVYTKSGMPRYKRYLDEMPGVPVQDLWDDIPYAGPKERLGYQTQKPLELLKRIVMLSSNPGDVILDPFCGCGTTIDAVETINREKDSDGKRTRPRRWIGIDLTHLAIHLIKHRLTRFSPPVRYEVLGEPADLAGAHFLAQKDRFQFKFWALGVFCSEQ